MRVCKIGGEVAFTATLSQTSNSELISKRGYMVGSENRLHDIFDMYDLVDKYSAKVFITLCMSYNNDKAGIISSQQLENKIIIFFELDTNLLFALQFYLFDGLIQIMRNIRSFGFNDMLLPFNIVNLFIQRLLTYDYRTSYLLRNTFIVLLMAECQT